MKYLIILGDGMADRPLDCFEEKTPLEVAAKPYMDKLAALGEVGTVKTVPDGFKPASDVANLSVLGYPPEDFYSGRSPLEALSIGVDMKDTDVAVRANLVTISDTPSRDMVDYSAGEISTPEARELIGAVQKKLGNKKFKFYAGVSYRHCLIIDNGSVNVELEPPHNISGKSSLDYMPKGEGADELCELIYKSEEVLKNHPINLKRIAEGKNPATNVWFWGAGVKPKLQAFSERFGLDGAVISAVDLLKGIAIGAKMEAPEVEGATGTLTSNFHGKALAAIDCFKRGKDFVYVHMEAPDECGHQGDALGKVKAIEKVDGVLGEVWDYLKSTGEDYVIACLPDHPTPIEIKTHSREPVPFALYASAKPCNSGAKLTEKEAQNGVFLPRGQEIMNTMLKYGEEK